MSPGWNIWAACCRQLVGARTPRCTVTSPGGRVAPELLPAHHLSAAKTSPRIYPRGGGKHPILTVIPDSSMSLPPHFLPALKPGALTPNYASNPSTALQPTATSAAWPGHHRHSPGQVRQHLPSMVPAASLPSAPLTLFQPRGPPCHSLHAPGTAQPQGLCLYCSLCPDLLKCHLLQEALLTSLA